jgi:hypothetical protein
MMLLRKNNLFSFQRIMKCLYLFCYAISKYDLDTSLDCLGRDCLDNPAEIAIWCDLSTHQGFPSKEDAGNLRAFRQAQR